MSKERLNVLAVIVIVLLVGCIFAIKYTSMQHSKIVGPYFLSADGDQFAVDASDRVLLLDKFGTTLSIKTYADLGLPDSSVSEMRLKENNLYLGFSPEGVIYECALSNWVCTQLASVRAATDGSFSFDLNEEVIVVSNTNKHNLAMFDRSGSALSESVGQPKKFCYPNEVRIQGGNIYVADTNSFRMAGAALAKFDMPAWEDTLSVIQGGGEDGKYSSTCAISGFRVNLQNESPSSGGGLMNEIHNMASVLSPKELGIARPGRVWPVAFEMVSREIWWLLVQDSFLQDGDLLIFEEGEAKKRVATPNLFEPLDIASIGKTVIVSDREAMTVYGFTSDGYLQGEFGDAAFISEMRSLKASKARYADLIFASRFAMGLLVLTAIVIFIMSKRTNTD